MHWKARDKTFLVTGGASGLGAACVEVLLDQGAKKVAVLDIAVDKATALVKRLNKTHGNKTVFIKCDVSREEEIRSAFDAVRAQFKQIDVIVNNAGVIADTPDLWRYSCDVNWQAVVSFTMKGVDHMRKDKGGAGGTIVNISSTAALMQVPFLPIYNGSKIAVLHFSQSLAMDPFSEYTGIRILVMCYGPTYTSMVQNLENKAYDRKLGQVMAISVALEDESYSFQSVESAVKGFQEMMRTGESGTVWVSFDNRPARNVTAEVNGVFKHLDAKIFS